MAHQIKSRIEIRIAVNAVQTGGAKGGGREGGRGWVSALSGLMSDDRLAQDI